VKVLLRVRGNRTVDGKVLGVDELHEFSYDQIVGLAAWIKRDDGSVFMPCVIGDLADFDPEAAPERTEP
jgi:hypothetical protein